MIYSVGDYSETNYLGDCSLSIRLRLIESADEMDLVEKLQRLIWPGSDVDIVPGHMLLTAAHNGGFVIGAFDEDSKLELKLVGFVFGFIGLYSTPDGPRPKHCSHMLGVDPAYRNQGVGFLLKRAQWQMVRHQELDRITWTYDPLLSQNANLNIAKLGAVCNMYLRELYGEMRDGLNQGVPSDRLQVDWWVNSRRVIKRLSRKARIPLDLAHFFAAGVEIINPTEMTSDGFPIPTQSAFQHINNWRSSAAFPSMLMVEIPSDYLALKNYDMDLAVAWRMHSRELLEELFALGYLVTDFVHLPSPGARSFYILSYGESTL